MKYHLFRRNIQVILTDQRKNTNSCDKKPTNDKALLDINPLQLKLLSIDI